MKEYLFNKIWIQDSFSYIICRDHKENKYSNSKWQGEKKHHKKRTKDWINNSKIISAALYSVTNKTALKEVGR